MLIVIDNYDSFTYNLVQYFGELGEEAVVFRNDQVNLTKLITLNPKWVVISPGPGDPDDGGISMETIHYFSGKIPLLGVCLGHQCIGAAFGAKIVRAPVPVHGKLTTISHHGEGLFAGISDPFEAVRYHSLVVERESLPASLQITATNEAGLIMGLQHQAHPTFGVQFHPESIFTAAGKELLANFLKIEI